MKKLMISTIILLPLIILAILLVSGAIKSLFTHIYVESVEFVDNSALVLVMEDEADPPSEQLEVNVFPLKAENREVAFSTDDETIVTVDGNGKVVAKYYGTATVTVTSVENRTKFAQRKVIVTDSHVHNITIQEHAEEMYVGDASMRLTAEVLPEGADNKNIEWTTDAPADILTVDKTTGIVTCRGSSKTLAGGVATITATSVDNPEVTATTTIRCHEPLSGLGIAESGRVVTALKEAQFPELVPYPADATYAVKYTASDSGVASVNAEGKITFHKAGQVTVTATATDGRGNTRFVTKDYDCTFGYFAGPLFGTAEKQTYDYDELTNGGELDIHFTKSPAGSNQEILRVEFAGPDLIEYDDATEKFTFKEVSDTTPLGTVTITVHALKYGSNHAVEEFDSDRLEVEFTRKTSELKFESGGEALSSVSVTARSLNLAELKGSAPGLGVRAIPENHTDTVSYSCESACASLVGTMLMFTGEGEATVTVSVGEVSATLKVSYTQPSGQDKTVTLDDSGETKTVALNYYEDAGDNAVLVFGAPDGYDFKIESDNTNVIKVEGQKLVPQRGGFANVTVTFVPQAGAAAYALSPQTVYTVRVYVDRAVEAGDITFAVEDTAITSEKAFTTAKSEVTLTITVEAKSGAMEGKDLYLDGAAAQDPQPQGDKVVYKKAVSFAAAQDITVTASVRYAGTATAVDPEKAGEIMGASNSCNLRSTEGKITSGLTVTKDGETLSAADNALAFENLGEKIQLTVKVENPEPADFVLETYVNESAVRAIEEALKANGYLDATMAVTGNTATIALTAASAAESAPLNFTIAGQKFALTVTVHVPADQITVEYANKPLTANDHYTTFLSELSFRVTLSRADGKTGGVSAAYRSVTATFGGEPVGGENVKPDGDGALSFTVKVKPAAESRELTITAEGGLAVFTVQLQKRTAAEGNFTYYITYSYGLVADAPEPHYNIHVGGANDPIFFPRGLRDFEIHIVQPEDPNRLGDFTDVAETTAFRIKEEGWKCEYHTASGSAGYLTVTVPEGKEAFTDEKITFVCPGEGGEAETVLPLTLPNINSVEMAGYDNSVATDVYKGYQQVRVFAKHSDYGDGKVVDYYRVPFTAEASVKVETAPGYAVWNISSHNDKTGERKLLVTQTWTTVTYYKNGDKSQAETYTVEDADGPSTLKKGETTIAEGGVYKVQGDGQVPWVDVFAEEGYAHIYFGNFAGLSEVDVQNDYFGNFGEQPTESEGGWKLTEQTVLDAEKEGSGRNFTPSANAYSYLRVAVGDGTADSAQATMEGGNKQKNTHFNFNVLADSTLVNVFNAAGYYAHSNLVLQENLYGEGELGTAEAEGGNKKLQEATEKGLFLTKTNTPWNSTDSTVLGKTTVYGNGYQINLQAKNEALKTAKPEEKNNSWGVSFGNLYNVFVKGANPEETVNVLRQKIVLIFTNAYYCDLQGYTKGRPQNNQTAYIKNTVLHSASQSAFQLFYTGEKAYLENVTVVECAAGITNEQRASEVGADHETNFYFKGNIDVLNYTNVRGVTNMAAGAVSDQSLGMLSGALTSVNDHFEWFGFNCTSDQFNTYNMPYFNLVIYTSNRKGVFNFWNGTSYVKSEDDILYKCSKCGATSANNQFCEMCFQGKMMPAFNYSYGAPEGGAPMKMVLDLSDYKSYLDGAEVTAWTYNYPKVGNKPVIHNGKEATYKVTVDGRLPNMSSTSFQYYRYMFTEERYIRLLCQYVNATDGGATLVKNEEHILWHMQQAYRDKSLLTGRNHDHMAALRESLTGKNITWPDNTTPEQAMQEYDEYHGQPAAAQMAALISETVIPSKRAY